MSICRVVATLPAIGSSRLQKFDDGKRNHMSSYFKSLLCTHARVGIGIPSKSERHSTNSSKVPLIVNRSSKLCIILLITTLSIRKSMKTLYIRKKGFPSFDLNRVAIAPKPHCLDSFSFYCKIKDFRFSLKAPCGQKSQDYFSRRMLTAI